MIDVRILGADELHVVDERLPLSRLDQPGGEYLVAWDRDTPVGHAFLAWEQTKLALPELQDVYVAEAHRRRGIASVLTAAAEERVRERGGGSLTLSVGEGNFAARTLYERLGFADAGVEPVRVSGTITIRGEPLEVDETLLYLVKPL